MHIRPQRRRSTIPLLCYLQRTEASRGCSCVGTGRQRHRSPDPATRPARDNADDAVPPRPRPQPALRPPPAKRHRAAARKSSVYLVPSQPAFDAIKERFPRARKALAALKWGGLLHATMLRFDDIDGAHRDLERIANERVRRRRALP